MVRKHDFVLRRGGAQGQSLPDAAEYRWDWWDEKEVSVMSDPTAREQGNDGEDTADTGGNGYGTDRNS